MAMNNLDLDYQSLLTDILENGVEKNTRNGKVLSVFGRQIKHKMSDGFPLLTTKKMAFKSIVTELLWFLKGDTNIKYLINNNCNIWTGDCYKNWCKQFEAMGPDQSKDQINAFFLTQEEFINKIKTDDGFAKVYGDLGKIYGFQWRNWNSEIDQISELIKQLKENPDSRRLLVSAWNPSDLPNQVLPPCHYSFQVYTRELSSQERKDIYDKLSYSKDIFPSDENGWNNLFNGYGIPDRAISLMYNMRSTDVGLGLSFNLGSYGLLLMMIAKEVNMVSDELITNMGDCHIYLNQIEGVKEQLTRTPYELPTVKLLDIQIDDIAHYNINDFILENYQSHPPIKMPLSN